MAPTPSSASGELWGYHVMPDELDISCLLPNGIIIVLKTSRETQLNQLKEAIRAKAEKMPLFDHLCDPRTHQFKQNTYVFVSYTLAGEQEEFYDETRRLCDLHLCLPLVRLLEPEGNRHEKILNAQIGFALGKPLIELDEFKNSEILRFRQIIFPIVKKIVERRTQAGEDLYKFPMDMADPMKVFEHLKTRSIPSEMDQINVCIWSKIQDSAGRQSTTLSVSCNTTPKAVITELLAKMSKKLFKRQSSSESNITGTENGLYKPMDFYLKIAGSQVYLLKEVPIVEYKHIQAAILEDKIPQLMLMEAKTVRAEMQVKPMISPVLLRRQTSISVGVDPSDSLSMWELSDDSFFKLRINTASSINAADVEHVYVKVGLFHGSEPIVIRDTDVASFSNPRWNYCLEFPEISIKNIPKAMQLCFSLCSVKQQRKQRDKDEHCALFWANLRLIDYNDMMLAGHMSIYLWPFPPHYDDLLNPLGHIGSNPDRDSPSLDIEFPIIGRPVRFPDKRQIQDYGSKMQLSKIPPTPQNVSPKEKEMFLQLIQRRFPLQDLSDQDSKYEKELVWRLRLLCKDYPNSLPRLLDAVNWRNREEVAQMYMLLDSWPHEKMESEIAMELLDARYPDPYVRQFAVRCLEENLSDDQLCLYLVSLVQVLKYEPFIYNKLAVFLLERALMNHRIGHFLFWNLRSEISYCDNWWRFALLLESYCRGSGVYLKSLIQQVEAVEKVMTISNELKDKREDFKISTQKLQDTYLAHKDSREKLQNIESPLNSCHFLGALITSNCSVIDSAKRPLWLTWKNPDELADKFSVDHAIIFKCGDDLRQDMLTLQVIKIMDTIWKQHGKDFRLTTYTCISTGKQSGVIEVVRGAKTIKQLPGGPRKFIQERARSSDNNLTYERAMENFKLSCAGYCVATFVLGIGDRHPSNIMMTEDGHIFHIDFGHFLGHMKKKLGINRERVPFVLADEFVEVITDGDKQDKQEKIAKFQNLCVEAYLILHRKAHLFLTLFAMMLCMGIPELQRVQDIDYLRRTLAVDKTEAEAIKYFREQFNDAYMNNWKTNINWMFHDMAHH